MIKELIQYPTPLSVKFATDVRFFNDELFALIDDLKDTINENNLVALSAFQIGNYYNVIVFKNEEGDFVEMTNPRLISHSDQSVKSETTTYFPGFSAEISRYENISIVYEDRNGANKSMKFSGELARTLQRKLDYTFGATFLRKMSKEEREKFEGKLEFGSDVGVGDYCPTTFKRDYVLKAANATMVLMIAALVVSLFISDKEILAKIWQYQSYAALAALGLNVLYFFYAQYEGKRYTTCVSCQIGNIIGTTFISLLRLSAIAIASYFLI
jgi:peptide deformylase